MGALAGRWVGGLVVLGWYGTGGWGLWMERAERLVALALCCGVGFRDEFALGWFDGGLFGGLVEGTGVAGGLLKGNCGGKSLGRAMTLKGWKLYPSGRGRVWMGDRRPIGLNARLHPVLEYFVAGRTRDER